MKAIKNLKIFKSKILTKAKFTLATLGIMSSFMAGCGKINQPEQSSSAATSVAAVPAVEATYMVEYDNPELLDKVELLEEKDSYDTNLSKAVLDKLNMKVVLSEESNNNIKEYISNIEVDYEYSDLYNIDENLEHYKNVQKGHESTSLNLIKNNKVDSNELYKAVLKNNQDIPNKAIAMDNSQIKEAVDIICDQINKKLAVADDVSYSNLDYTLSNLRIFNYKNFGTAYVDLNKPILYLNFDTINNLQEVNNEKNIYEVTLRHETDHLMQVSYAKDSSFETNLGICYSFKNVDINSINWKWFYEGSAEKLYLETGEIPYTYRGEVNAIESLTMATILNENVDENDIEELSLQHNLDKLFDKFKAKTYEEKKEIINMMFSYDLALNNTEEFSKVYKEKYGKKLDVEKKEELRYSSLSSIGQTLNKTFYLNLTDCILNNNLSIKEIFSLISLYETKMNSVIRFDESGYEKEKLEFIENYSNIQLNFFDELSKFVNMETLELRSLYCNYHNANRNNDYDYEFLSKGEQAFFNEIDNKTTHNFTEPIISRK